MRDLKEEKQLKAFGRRLAEIRKNRGFTQQKLAEDLDMSLVAISYIETGKRWPRLATLHRIAYTLNVRIGDMFKDL